MSPSPQRHVAPEVRSELGPKLGPEPGSGPHSERLAALLRDLGPSIRRGGLAGGESVASLATGLPAIDRLTLGGFPPGRLSELSGPLSSGRTSLALSLLARATRAGELVAWVDGPDAFHPASAAAAGVTLERVLWARPPGLAEAARCCERLIQARGFAVVLLDLTADAESLPSATWQRLARATVATGTALLVLSRQRATGTFADLALELQPPRARFAGTPSLLEGLEIEAVVVRQRRGPTRGVATVRLEAASRAA